MENKPIMRIVVMMTEDNIVGRELLNEFGKNGISIAAVIVEMSERAEREKAYLKNNFYDPPSFQIIRELFPTDIICVPKLNDDESRAAVSRYGPDIIILDGSTIVKKAIFSIAKIGALNSHPGLLPEYRGVDSVRWSIYHGNPAGATCHFVDEGIDTGPILVRREVPYSINETLLEIRVRVMRVCVEVMVQAVQGLMNGTLKPISQPTEGNYYSWAPPEVRAVVDKKLKPS